VPWRTVLLAALLAAAASPAVAADCAKRLCKQMNSCAEAYEVLTACGRVQLDGDGDGIPCENICRDGLVPAEREPLRLLGGFACSPRKTCKQMSGCAEARFQLEQCGNRALDRDGDGTPCESIC
jgi:hypothetical protein